MITLTKPQSKVLDYLYRSGYATSRSVANMLYGDRRQTYQASVVLIHLEDKSLVRPKGSWTGTPFSRISMWELTDAGMTLARARALAFIDHAAAELLRDQPLL